MDKISIGKITKGNNSAKNSGGATVDNLCMSSGHALYFYQVFVKLSRTVSKLYSGHDFYTENFKGE